MTFHLDETKPEGHVERYFSLTVREHDADDTLAEVPKHWHKHHDEYMSCEEGHIELYLDGTTIIAKSGDPAVFIPRRKVHGFKFPKGEKAVLKEMTQPTGEFKQRFFEDILADWGFWNAMRGFADGDTYIALPGPFRWLDELYMMVVAVLVKLVHPRAGEVPKSVAPLVAIDSKKEL
jgi:mannose-6-phosphate isomerase-like protein (cupin superfamily)